MMENYSLSDIRAATGDGMNGGFGNDLFLVILFLFFFGNGNGFGNRGFGEAATAAAQNEILLGQQFGSVESKLNEIGNGICNSTYALNTAITGEGRAIQTQLAECCCNTQLLGKDILAGIHAEGEATRAMFRENEIQNLRDKVSDLQLKSSQCDQNAYLINQLKAPCPVPAYLTCSPYQTYTPCGFGNGYQPNI